MASRTMLVRVFLFYYPFPKSGVSGHHKVDLVYARSLNTIGWA